MFFLEFLSCTSNTHAVAYFGPITNPSGTMQLPPALCSLIMNSTHAFAHLGLVVQGIYMKLLNIALIIQHNHGIT
jgi:hypothetical protein